MLTYTPWYIDTERGLIERGDAGSSGIKPGSGGGNSGITREGWWGAPAYIPIYYNPWL